MAAYYTSQAYDAPPSLIWSMLTDFDAWPHWFPHVSRILVDDGAEPAQGATLLAVGDDPDVWTRWQIVDWTAPVRLMCEHVESNAAVAPGVSFAYLQFELMEDPEGCTLEVEIGAEGSGLIGDFFIGMTLGPGARRLLPQLVDAFTGYVVDRVAGRR